MLALTLALTHLTAVSPLHADTQAHPIAIAAAFEPANGAPETWWPDFQASFSPTVAAAAHRSPDSFSRALASKPAIVLLQTNTRTPADLRDRIRQALQARAIPVLITHNETADAIRQLTAPDKITTLDTALAPQRPGIEMARELCRLQPQLQPYLRIPGRDVEVTVSADGAGDFKTIQYAIDHTAVPAPNQRLIIHIKPGTYRERVLIPRDRVRITFRGADPKTTIITARMGATDAGGTFHTATVRVLADDFLAENLTIENTYGTGTQAVALHLESDRTVIRNCRLLAWQDTLFAASGRQYFRDCYIEGHVDFIFGNATTVFENCEIQSLGNGYITAHSRLQPNQTTGFVFYNCRLTAKDPSLRVFLGRPWRPYARVIFSHCWMDKHIVPAAWDNWSSTLNEKTAVFAELDSTGPGAQPAARAPWARSITPQEASAYLPAAFLRGADNWTPGN